MHYLNKHRKQKKRVIFTTIKMFSNITHLMAKKKLMLFVACYWMR